MRENREKRGNQLLFLLFLVLWVRESYGELGFKFLESVLVHYYISLFFFIVKFLRRLRGGRQFAEPRKFLCSLCVLVI